MEPRKPDISAGFSGRSECKAFSGSNGTVNLPETNSKKPAKVLYKECLKNHAASIGGHAVDGCGEFMPSSNDADSPAAALKCAACGCHRNFHRRETDSGDHTTTTTATAAATTNSHCPCDCYLKPSRQKGSPSSPSYYHSPYNSAPQMLLALSTGLGEPENPEGTLVHQASNPGTRKRFRTKFTQEQKEKMNLFSEKLGWRLQKQDDGLIQQFCNEIGVSKRVLKVWMHNNKHTFAKKDTDICE